MAENTNFTIWHGLLLSQCVALVIGLAMPITPNKSGSDFSMADPFFENPTYLQEVLVYYIMTNLLLAVLGLVFALWCRLGDSKSQSSG